MHGILNLCANCWVGISETASPPTKMKLDGATISGELNRLLSRSSSSESDGDTITDLLAVAEVAAATATTAASAAANAAAMAATAVNAMKQQNGVRPANKPSFLEELAKKKGAPKESKTLGSESAENVGRPPANPLSFLEELAAKKSKKEASVSPGDPESAANASLAPKPSFLDELKRKKKGGDPVDEPQSSGNDPAVVPRRPSFLEELASRKKEADDG